MRVFKLKTKLISALLILAINPLSAVQKNHRNEENAEIRIYQQPPHKNDKSKKNEISQQPIKAHIEYKLEYDEEIPLRVTQIPTNFGMIDKDIEGELTPLNTNAEVVLENIYDIRLSENSSSDNQEDKLTKILLPKGSKFYAKVKNAELAKSFNRDGFIELEFYKIEVITPTRREDVVSNGAWGQSQHQFQSISIPAGTLKADNIELRESFSNKASKVGKALGYTLGGALIAPLISYQIAGVLAFSNPYITSGAAATGAAIGLAYGVASKGKNFNLEPGSEIKLKLNNDWLLSELDSQNLINSKAQEDTENSTKSSTAETKTQLAQKALLKINRIKKSGSNFNQKCLKINLDYENKSTEAIRFLSFRLVDSMNKEYFPDGKSFKGGQLAELPQTGNLDLLYCVDFSKAIYNLELRGMSNYELLASERVVLY
jgi:hypothetical protein